MDTTPTSRAPAVGADAKPAAAPAPFGVGIDAEQAARFARHAGGPSLRHVFSEAEAARLAALPDPAVALCTAFCAKEALLKALGERYAFPECECRWEPGAAELGLTLSPGLTVRHDVASARAIVRVEFLAARGECVVEVHLRRAGGAAPDPAGAPGLRTRLASFAIADIEARRDEVAAAQFSPEEIAGLGKRRIQSLAGALALKEALAELWREAGLGSPAAREFVVGHLASGAPVLIALPGGIAPERVAVSISHTRAFAYGLAALAR